MNEQMEFPETFEEFAKEYGFKDDKEVYTNGLDLIPIFRVKQWLEHDKSKTVLYSGDGYADGYMVYDMAECPNCGYEYEDGDKDWGLPFCPNCGQALNWESEVSE